MVLVMGVLLGVGGVSVNDSLNSQLLRRQQTTLDKLRAENKTLKTDVARLQTRHITQPTNSFEQSQLDRLCQQSDRYSGLVESEKVKAGWRRK